MMMNYCVETPYFYHHSPPPFSAAESMWRDPEQHMWLWPTISPPASTSLNDTNQEIKTHQQKQVKADDVREPVKKKRRRMSGDRDNTPCCACADKAGPHVYYGARACIPCRAFFRRSVEEKLHHSYVCFKTNRNCDISKQGRKACKYCRFQVSIRRHL